MENIITSFNLFLNYTFTLLPQVLDGLKVLGIERSTFIIDENGILIKEFRKVKVKGHIDSVLSEI